MSKHARLIDQQTGVSLPPSSHRLGLASWELSDEVKQMSVMMEHADVTIENLVDSHAAMALLSKQTNTHPAWF